MKILTFVLLLAFTASAQKKADDAPVPDPPKVTAEQKLVIVTAQRDLASKQGERSAIESRLKDLVYAEIPQAQKAIENAVSAATPTGYTMSADFVLHKVPDSKPLDKKVPTEK